jgi:Family of unknown function (DUF6223)
VINGHGGTGSTSSATDGTLQHGDSSVLDNVRKSNKRTITLILGTPVVLAAFAGLVHAVLVASHVSEPAGITVYGPTPLRLWATAAAGLALGGVVIGGLALVRSVRHIGNRGRRGATVALLTGPIGAVNGALVLAVSTGGPGSGNGVVGGAAALVLGLIATVLGGLVFARSRRAVRSRDGS